MMKKYLMLALSGLLFVACSSGGDDDDYIEPTLTLSHEQVVGNWKDTYGRDKLTDEWVAATNPFIHCFDDDGTFRILMNREKFAQGTWTLAGNKINVTVEDDAYTYEVLSVNVNEVEFAYYINGALNNYGRVVRTKEDEKAKIENQTFTAGGISFTMVAVEGGTFLMGSPDADTEAEADEKPQHFVTLSDFYIGETEVTQALWKAVMGSNPSYSVGENLPVEEVSWEDCQAFITKLNEMTGQTFRLPTEAEWEYAARGGNKTQGCQYSGSNDINLVAWYDNNSEGKTHEVGKKTANELGIYDMSGNVFEWCQDWKGNYSSEVQTNPTGPETGSYRVSRGGSWNIYARLCRVSYRDGTWPLYRLSRLGLRLAMSAE